MKPLLLLPLFALGTLADRPSIEERGGVGSACVDGNTTILEHETVVRNKVRTDVCNGENEEMEISECRIPGQNRTIYADPTHPKNIKTGDGSVHHHYCLPYGYEGVTIVHNSGIQFMSKVDPTNEDGFCSEGTMKYIPNQQWEESDYVKRCNPKTSLVEIIGCRTHDGAFMPVGSNRTDERFVKSLGNVTSIEQCYRQGNTTAFNEYIFILPENDFQGCVGKIKGEKVALTVGQSKTVGKVLYKCVKEVFYSIKLYCIGKEDHMRDHPHLRHLELIARVPLGGHVMQDGREMICLPTGDDGAELTRVDIGSAPNCDGRKLNATWEKDRVVYTCDLNESGKPVEKITACIENRPMQGAVEISVDKKRDPSDIGYSICVLSGNGTAKLEYVPPTCRKGAKKLNETWIDGPLVKKCKREIMCSTQGSRIEVVGCARQDNVTIPVHETREISKEETCSCERFDGDRVVPEDRVKLWAVYNATLKCTRKDAPTTVRPNACSNGKGIGATWTEKGVVRGCNSRAETIARFCRTKAIKKDLQIGQLARENGIQYSCERRGKSDAELVVKTLDKLCRDGDASVDAWISDNVLWDCVRSGNKSEVKGRLCIVEEEESILEVGDSLNQEYESYRCVRKGKFGAALEVRTAYNPEYFTRNDTCKNGKKVGEEWMDMIYVRRACRNRKGQKKPVIVDLGCVIPDGKLIAVKAKASWQEPGFFRHLHCKEGPRGFGAYPEFFDVQVRDCGGDKVEGEEWIEKNILRTCKEVDDKLQIVAIRCVSGNDSLEIGAIRKISRTSFVECVRVGNYDAAVYIDFLPEYFECENRKKLDEEWTEGIARRSCRKRDGRPTIVAIGCALNDGRILGVGVIESKTVVEPGYEIYHTMQCVAVGDYGVALIGQTARSAKIEDKKNPCGPKAYGEVWAKKSFLKKCKTIGDNILSAVTIGCVTVKETQMLEGQYLTEDDYNIKCSRNEDDKMEMTYSMAIVEQ